MKLDLLVLLAVVLLAGGPAGASGLGDLPEYAPNANDDRDAIPDVYKWNLSDLVVSLEAWDAEAAAAAAKLAALEDLRKGLDDPQRLHRYLEAFFEVDEQVNRITLYANLARDSATTDQKVIARHQSAIALTNQVMAEGPTLRQAILAVSDEDLAEAYGKVDGLLTFKPFIDGIRRRAHTVLPPEGERVLGLAGDNLWAQIDLNELPYASENAFAALISEIPLPEVTDEQGEKVQLTFSNYGRLRGSADREVRRQTVEGMFTALTAFENSFAATLAGQAAFDVFLARSRRYDTALEAYLDKDQVDTAVYRTLVDTVKAHAASLHRYVELRRRVMGVDEVHLYDLYVPMVEGVDREIPYAEGVGHILDSLGPLGEDYVEQAAVALDPANGWVDVYPSRDKASGAFSAAANGVHPYLKMNFQNRFNNVSTLAHELGHALHSYLSMGAQSYLAWRYPPFLAEVASTSNEMLLSQYMIENATSDEEKAWLLSELLESIRQTIFRQTLFADFELQVHELVEAGEPVTADVLSTIYGGLIRTYYGPEYAMGEHDAIEWAYIPHFYWKYYVFNYATGLSSGIAIAEKLSQGGEPERQAYLTMLRGGSLMPPLEQLRDAGVDLTKADAIESALELFDRTLDALEEVLLK